MTGRPRSTGRAGGAVVRIEQLFERLATGVEDRPADALRIERLGALLAAGAEPADGAGPDAAGQDAAGPDAVTSDPSGRADPPASAAGPGDGRAGNDVLSSRST